MTNNPEVLACWLSVVGLPVVMLIVPILRDELLLADERSRLGSGLYGDCKEK